jgi:hypothetical protein
VHLHHAANKKNLARPERFERRPLRFVAKGTEAKAYRRNRELGNRTSFAPETVRTKSDKRNRTETKELQNQRSQSIFCRS